MEFNQSFVWLKFSNQMCLSQENGKSSFRSFHFDMPTHVTYNFILVCSHFQISFASIYLFGLWGALQFLYLVKRDFIELILIM